MTKPGPTNTGLPKGTTLAPSGSITVKKVGQIVEWLDIAGTITVLANDVTIRKVHIKTGDYYPIRYFDDDNTGLVVEDSEIEGTSGNVTSNIAFARASANPHPRLAGIQPVRQSRDSTWSAAVARTRLGRRDRSARLGRANPR